MNDENTVRVFPVLQFFASKNLGGKKGKYLRNMKFLSDSSDVLFPASLPMTGLKHCMVKALYFTAHEPIT